MTESSKALTELPRPPRATGGMRATLALLVAFVALAIAVYGVVQIQGLGGNSANKYDILASDVDGLRSRLDEYANKHTLIVKEIANIGDEIQALQKSATQGGVVAANGAPSSEDTGAVKDLEARLSTLEEENTKQKNEVMDALKSKTTSLGLLASVQSIRYKLQQGLSYNAEIKRIETIPDIDAVALQTLEQGKTQEGLSDQALLQGLTPVAAAFVAREKMQKADGILDKVGIQLEKLVVIRAKDGHDKAQSPMGRVMDELRRAMTAEEWDTVKKITDELKANPVKDFDVWYKPLLQRMDLEKAATALEERAMVVFGTAKPKEETLADKPVEEKAQPVSPPEKSKP